MINLKETYNFRQRTDIAIRIRSTDFKSYSISAVNLLRFTTNTLKLHYRLL